MKRERKEKGERDDVYTSVYLCGEKKRFFPRHIRTKTMTKKRFACLRVRGNRIFD